MEMTLRSFRARMAFKNSFFVMPQMFARLASHLWYTVIPPFLLACRVSDIVRPVCISNRHVHLQRLGVILLATQFSAERWWLARSRCERDEVALRNTPSVVL